jgi:hypothetical protein
MTLPRWPLMLVAALASVAGLIYAVREPAEPTPAPAAHTAVAALPLHLPASRPGPAAASAASTPAIRPLPRMAPSAAAPRIGSEGYGPHIERAQAGSDAAAAWEAVQWLRRCATTEEARQSFEQARNRGVAPELMTQLMQEADAEGRRCQTVTARHRALLPELSLRAMRGGVPEAASVYAGAIQPDTLAPALREEVTAAMRRDALAGHPGALLGAIATAEDWQLGETEKLGYLFAYGEMAGGRAVADQMVRQATVGLKVPTTPEQLAAAKQAGQQIIDRARAKP